AGAVAAVFYGWPKYRLRKIDRSIDSARDLLAAGDWQSALAEALKLKGAKLADEQPGRTRRDPLLDKRLTDFEAECLYAASEAELANHQYTEAMAHLRAAGQRIGMLEGEATKRVVEAMLAELRRRIVTDPAADDAVSLAA